MTANGIISHRAISISMTIPEPSPRVAFAFRQAPLGVGGDAVGADGGGTEPGVEDAGGGTEPGVEDDGGSAEGERGEGATGERGVEEGEGGGVEVGEATSIWSFMPPAQCPGIPQTKYLEPVLLSVTTVLPPVLVDMGLLVVHEL